jgi:hypothetical protein
VVRIRRSKTDQEAAGVTVGIAADDDGACPAAEAWAAWRAHLARVGVTRGQRGDRSTAPAKTP